MRHANDPYRPTTLKTEEARQGEVSGHMRLVLGVSLVFAIIAGAAFVMYYA